MFPLQKSSHFSIHGPPKVPESSSWSSASVGRATATLQKVTPETWEQKGVSKNRGIPKWMVYNGKPY